MRWDIIKGLSFFLIVYSLQFMSQEKTLFCWYHFIGQNICAHLKMSHQ